MLAVALLVALALSGASARIGAATSGGGGFDHLAHLPGTPGLDPRLADVAATPASAGSAVAQAQGVPSSGNSVRVIVEPAGTVGAAEDAVVAAGGQVEASAVGLVQALVPPGSLVRLAGESGVAEVRPPAQPFPQAVDEGVAVTNATAWQSAGDDGAGVKIAIIDLGFYGYTSLLGTALPASVGTDDHCHGAFASPPSAGGTQHGTAVAELVHQMAPAAQLILMCVDSEVDLALAEQDAVAGGVKIVNHSVGWFDTSRGDGTGAAGTPDAIAADARAHGILWVNAAGNYATQHWSGTFTADAGDPDTNDFAPGQTLNTVTIQSGEQACAFLRWDDWPLTTEDFDLYLIRESDSTVVASSTNDQSGAASPSDAPGPPTEDLCYANDGPTQAFGLAIVRFSASGTPRFDLFYDGSSDLAFATAAGSVIEPASSPAVLAAGADCWETGSLEPYSSQGPTVDGRLKPDLLAPDSVSTSTYGSAPASPSTCGTAGFPGTSASAPQVTGAAADVLGRTPSLTPAGLEGDLEATSLAHDSAAAATPEAGHGLLWLGSPVLPASPTAPSNTTPPSLSGTPTAGEPLQASVGKWAGSFPMAFTYGWERCNSAGASCSTLASGESWYTPVAADAGSTLRVVVSAANGGAALAATSPASGVVVPARPVATAAPTIAGSVGVGQTLTVTSTGTWSGSPSLVEQWRRCDSDGATCTSIAGATGTSYTLTSADVGHRLRVAVTATNGGGSNIATSVPAAVALGQQGGSGGSAWVTMFSDSGDYVGQGVQREFDGSNALINVKGTSSFFTVGVSGGTSGDAFTMDFAAPPGTSLHAGGVYTDAQRAVFREAGRPGIDIYGDGRGCDTDSGEFEVKELTADTTGAIQSVWILYEQHCGGSSRALWGEVRLGEPTTGALAVAPSIVRWPGTDAGTLPTVVPVTVAAVSGSSQIAGVSITGTNAGDFAVRADGCTGATVAPGGACQVWLRFSPRTPGTRVATLQITDGGGNIHDVALQGFVYGGTTSVTMTSDAGDFVGEGRTYSYSAANDDLISLGGDREGAEFDVTGANGDRWDAEFAAPAGDILVPGSTYSATRYPFNGSGAGIAVSGNGHGCNTITGSFTVGSATYDSSGSPESMSISFEQHCEGSAPALRGTFSFRVGDSTLPAPWMIPTPGNGTSAPPGTVVTMLSDSGDYIGGGEMREYDPTNATVSVGGDAGDVQVSVAGGTLGDDFQFRFGAPPGTVLASGGVYVNVQSDGGQQGGHAGMDVFGDGRGCDEVSGQFEVKDLVTDHTGAISRLWIVYEQHCEGGKAALWGEVRYAEPASGLLLAAPSVIRWPAADEGSSPTIVPATFVAAGGSTALGTASISGPAAGDFSARDDECSGRTIPAGGTCQIWVRFTPAAAGTQLATLHLTDGSGSGYNVALQGFVYGGTTSVTLTSDAGDFVGAGTTYGYSAAGGDFITLTGTRTEVHFSVDASSGDYWDADFAPGSGDILAAGSDYANATRYPFNGTGAGLDVEGDSRGCNTLTGSFTVNTATFNPDGSPKTFAASFVQHCEGAAPALHGTFSYRAGDSTPLAPWLVGGTGSATRPAPPTNVVATAASGQATVSFTPPVDDGGATITSYTVTASPGGRTASGGASPITVTGLTNGTAYTFTVTATNAAGTSAASAPSNAVTPAATATPPGMPANAVATAGNGQASVAFSPPASDGGSAITAYTVTASPGGKAATGTGSPLIVSGLANGTAYTFTVIATNAAGTSPPSAPSNTVTPAAPALPPGTPTNAVATAGNGQATVSFIAPASNGGSPITAYTVTSAPGGKTASGAASPITVTGLTNGTAYTFVVTAANAAGTGPASASSNTVTPAAPAGSPGTPTGVTATPGNSQATVSFSPPSANGGAAITSYTVTSIPGGERATGAASPLVVTGLTNGTSYTFVVAATNAAGPGAASAPSVPVTPLGPPGAPTAVTSTAGNAQASVAFAAPADNGGSPITGYTVTASPGGVTATGSASPIAITGLDNGTSYSFTVTATSAAGTGPASSASNAVTPAAPVSTGGGGGSGGSPAAGGGGSAPAATTTPVPAAPVPTIAPLTPPVVQQPVAATASVRTGFTVAKIARVSLAGKPPQLRLTVKLSRAATLRIVLRTGSATTLASWNLRGKAGSNTFRLTLPMRARRAAHDQVQVSAAGTSASRRLAVVVGT